MQPSYVFQHRPLTPPRHIKQTHYCSELDDQVSHLNGQARERREREEREGREEQVQLAKEYVSNKKFNDCWFLLSSITINIKALAPWL